MNFHIVVSQELDDLSYLKVFTNKQKAKSYFKSREKVDHSGFLDLTTIKLSISKLGIIEAIEYANRGLPR